MFLDFTCGVRRARFETTPTKARRCQLVDLGTFGGPNTYTNDGSVIISNSEMIVGEAHTCIACPRTSRLARVQVAEQQCVRLTHWTTRVVGFAI